MDGERHLGAAIGSECFKKQYINEKIGHWINDVKEIADIAKEEPQAAYIAYVSGIAHRWSFVQRTVDGIAELFLPLENTIRHMFLPALLGRQISDDERALLKLPLRFGGLGITDPSETANQEYRSSKRITEALTRMIENQDQCLANLDKEESSCTKKNIHKEKNETYETAYQQILQNSPPVTKRCLELARQKGASSWLSCLPLKSLGYALNKEEFRDAIALRYGWTITGIPKFCACGKESDIDHLLTCPKGGYSIMRHNALRDCFAKLLEDFCKDVQIEPRLIRTQEELTRGTTQADGAKLDVAARGIWIPMDKTFLDIRVTHPNAPSQISKPIASIFANHENEKKRTYLNRVIEIEKASFTAVVFATTGGCAPEAEKLMTQIATPLRGHTPPSNSNSFQVPHGQKIYSCY